MPPTVIAVCQTTVIDGRNGAPLLLPYIRSSVGAQTSPLTVSLEGLGHDILRQYWGLLILRRRLDPVFIILVLENHQS